MGRGKIPEEGAPGEGTSPHWADKTPPFFPPSPRPKEREGKEGAERAQNNNEITITKANTGARAPRSQPRNPR